MTAFSETIGNAARSHLLRFFLRAPFLWVLRVGTSEMLFGFSAGTQLGQTLLTALQIFSNALMILTIFLGLVVVSPVPALTFLCVLGLGGYLIVKATRKMLNARAAAVYRADLATHNIQQTVVHGLKEMRLYGREAAIFSAYTAKLNDVLVARKWFQALSRLPVGSLEILGFASLVGVLLFLIFVQNAGIATISGIMGFMTQPLILGTVQLGQPYGIANTTGQPEQQEANSIVRTAWDAGIMLFDTAQGYGNSESVLGAALRHCNATDTARIITKLAPTLPADAPDLRSSVTRSLRTLGVKKLYCLMPDAFVDAGQMYWFQTAYFLAHETAISPKTRVVELPREACVDIDTFEDWSFAERIAAMMK